MDASWTKTVIAAISGGAAAFLLLTLTSTHDTQNWTASATTSRIQSVDALRVPQLKVAASQYQVPAPLEQMMVDGAETEVQSQSAAPLVLAVSGVMLLVAAAYRMLRPMQNTEYAILPLTGQYRTQREQREQEKAAAAQREIQERLQRLKAMGAYVPPTAASASVPSSRPVASVAAPTNEWESRQQERERREREKEAAAQREIQERLQRLKAMGAYVPPQVAAAAAPVSAPRSAAPAVNSVPAVSNDWTARQQDRDRREQEKAAAAQREIQERLQRLKAMGAYVPPTATVAAAPVSPQAASPAVPTQSYAATNEWELRQQERERREREKAAAAQREIQERLARLARLGAAQATAEVSKSMANVR